VPADGGIRFGQYVLLRRIARGGMAEVFLAQQRGLEGFDRRVAVKRILPHLADSPDFVKMFLGEAKLAAQLAHPNIVHIYDFGKVDQDYFIAMEYVDGVHAGQLFKLAERVPPVLLARMGADAAAALHHAHELRGPNGKPLALVHRDVSPANLMVSFDGVVKLCDFGIAKAAALSDQLTQPGQVKGKYAYMSPEQTVAGTLDGRSDVYSLAIVMWELLSGKTVVPRGDAVAAMRAIRDGKITPIAQAAPGTPAPLAEALAWALQVKREQRATAAELAQALEAFVKASPEIATPMQVGAWIRQRFPRDSTGQHPALGNLPNTPNTQAAPRTMLIEGTKVGADTPDVPVLGATARPVPTGDEIPTMVLAPEEHATVLDELAKQLHGTVALGPATQEDPSPSSSAETSEEPSRLPDLPPMQGPIYNATPPPSALRSPATPGSGVRGRPQARELSFPRRITPISTETQPTLGVRPTRARRMLPIFVLIGLAVTSFVIVLAAKTPSQSQPSPQPAHAPPADALAVADAPGVAIVIDATEPTTLLEVHTRPSGAMVRVGDQSRVSPAKFALAAGHYTLVAELDGWVPERREIDLIERDHLVQEVAFTRRASNTSGGGSSRQTPPPPPQPPPPEGKVGLLTVRTTPYAEVYIGGRKLGETPFADVQVEVGTHTLTFKNPSLPTVKKTITISATKPVKLNFDLRSP